jgi:hypothetical protein
MRSIRDEIERRPMRFVSDLFNSQQAKGEGQWLLDS